MHDDRAEVDQDPARLGRPFDRGPLCTGHFELFEQLVTDSVHLPGRGPIAQNIVIGQQGHLTHIKHHNI